MSAFGNYLVADIRSEPARPWRPVVEAQNLSPAQRRAWLVGLRSQRYQQVPSPGLLPNSLNESN